MTAMAGFTLLALLILPDAAMLPGDKPVTAMVKHDCSTQSNVV
ncbi:hypothetical protein PBN151_0629 [Paenibacillus sp. NAIST15-1]|nr:hypothetical protein PBN151_0629 [Paenibacillus sp. NAIST15-1]